MSRQQQDGAQCERGSREKEQDSCHSVRARVLAGPDQMNQVKHGRVPNVQVPFKDIILISHVNRGVWPNQVSDALSLAAHGEGCWR